MAISREYARLLGGDINFTSEEFVGTSFCLTLIVEETKMMSKANEPSDILRLTPGQEQKKVLLVDDKIDNRSLVRKMLEPLGFVVVEASDGEQAISQFNAENPDLVLMDKRMPVMDGLEATRRIKATKRGQQTPIIAMTAHAFEEERQVILAQGADDFLRKPFRRHVLLAMISKHLNLDFEYSESESESTAKAPPDPKESAPKPELREQPKEPVKIQANLIQKSTVAAVELSTTSKGSYNNKILIVDDVKANRLLLRMMLTREGYSCEEAKNGIEALAMFENWQPDVVLLDIQMPEMNGYEVLESVEANKSNNFAPIIALTADNDSDEILKLKSMGAKDVFSKPIVQQELLASIRQQIAAQ